MQFGKAFNVARAVLASAALCVSLVPAPALAQGATETVLVQDTSQAVDGNVEVTDTTNAVKVVSTGANDASVQVSGDVSNTNNGAITDVYGYVIGVNLQSHDTGQAKAQIGGDVTVSSTPEESKSNAEGVFVRDGAGSEAARISAEIGGDVNVNSHGAARGVSSISSNAKSDFSVEVGGNITATSTGLVPPGKDDVDGLEVQTAKDAISHIVVGGTIAVNAPQEKTGAYGVTVYGDEKSQTDIHVKGSISSNGGGESTGARLSSIGGDIRFKADQDVSGMSTDDQEGVGMVLESSKGGKVELVASGVVYGDKAGIRFDGDGAGTYDMTVWQVKSGQDGVLFSRGEISHEDLGSLTSQVKYIIRLEQPQEGGTIGATDALHAALAQSHGYDVARAGDKVYLNVNLDDGYYVSGAFNGRGEQVALLKDEGGYYVIVPEGGGVYLKVSLGKNAEVASEPEQAVPTDEARTYTTSKASAPLVVSAATNLLPATADASTSAAALVACVLLGAGLAFSGIVDRWR